MKRIDAHLHVWANDPTRYPFNPKVTTPALRADAEFLVSCMDAAGVAGALIIQPIVYAFDHRYVSETLRAYPTRFQGMCLMDPQHPDPPAELARWKSEGYVAVRVNPNLFPSETRLDSRLGQRIFAAAGELKMPVGFLINPDHFDAVDALCEAHPETVAVIDHFGHCRPSAGEEPAFGKLIAMSRHPNLYVKLSEFPRASYEEWPYADLHRWVYQLLDSYGPERLMWATDFPFIVPQCGYERGLTLLTEKIPRLDSDTMAWLVGRTAEKVFGPWN
jgi:predicted TIM-barrel fold metal-dependent hydrolase